jgi:hypothetical protein
MRLFNSLFGRRGGARDGSSPGRAIVVGSVVEEHAWMRRHCSGFQPGFQALQFIDGKPYDALIWHNDQGEKRTVFFDISSFFGR